jgi:glycosyltransferase involved in cell wall biosynthesis
MRLTDLVTPLKPLEAMAQGSIIVASDVGGHKELIIEGKTGYLFRAGDVEALAERLALAIDQRDLWPAMRLAGRRFIEAERTWDRVTACYAPIYEALLHGQRGG